MFHAAGGGALPKRPLEALASVGSPFANRLLELRTSPPPPSQSPQPPNRSTQPLSQPSRHAPQSGETIVGELFQLADVCTTGWVKLPNVAAALRLRKICFDLPRIARCFQRAARVYEEMTGLRNEAGRSDGSPGATHLGTSTLLNREGFDLMTQIIFNDLKTTRELPEDILDRWQYEQRYATR
jgi:hypothetical protein